MGRSSPSSTVATPNIYQPFTNPPPGLNSRANTLNLSGFTPSELTLIESKTRENQMPFQVPFNRLALATLALLGIAALGFGAATLLGVQVFVLKGHSMEPTITPGSLVIAHEVPVDDIAVGDITLFRVGWLEPGVDVTAAHRVTETVPQGAGVLAFTKGDGNTIADPMPTFMEGSAVRADFTLGNGRETLLFVQLLAAIIIVAFTYIAIVSTIGALITTFNSSNRSQAAMSA